ncbi:TonB-dependent receptor family protein [Paucihalobacter sp.]|uniref:TonB-dependent receptor family protein n=1 Tax=Paucihalobacter sp. TaxID=2850405 RepID=UPI002FE0DB74
MSNHNKFNLVIAILLISNFCLNAQVKTDTTQLSEVKISTGIINSKHQNSATSVSEISARDLNQTDGIIITSALNAIPGVTMQQGNLNTNRITIRGIGARSQFSTNRIKAYFDNIPLTNAEGESVFEDIDIETLGGLTILKGPNNSIYGSGLGGVILLKSKNINQSFAKTTSQFGSFGLWRQNLSAGFQNETSHLILNYNHLESDGFRDNSNYNRDALNISGSTQITENSKLSFVSIFTRLKAFIPSSINKTDFDNNPEVAPQNWAQSEGFESYHKAILGLNYEVNLNQNWQWSTSVFGNYKNAYEPRPFDILADNTTGFGLRSVLKHQAKLWSHPTQWIVGTELVSEDFTFSLFENLYQSQPGNGSIEGDEFAKVNQRRNYVNAFFNQETNIDDKLFLELGISLSSTSYNQKDIFENAEDNMRENYSFETTFTPRIGASYKLSDNNNLFASVSNGFSVPSVAETLTPDGQINTDLKPERGWNYEVGIKSRFFDKNLYAELTLYSLQIENLLVARRVAEDQFVGINAGESSHKGAEISLKYSAAISNRIDIYPYFTGSFNKFEFKDFIDGDNDFSGNKLTGAPNYQWQTGIDLQTAFGFSFNFSILNVGEIPLNDSNSLSSDAYSVTNCKAMYQFTLLKRISTQLSAGVNNLFDANYAASILPNAVGFGNALPRYYYPGAPLNFYGGVSLMYKFQSKIILGK